MFSENLNDLTKKITQSIVRCQGRSVLLSQQLVSERWEDASDKSVTAGGSVQLSGEARGP